MEGLRVSDQRWVVDQLQSFIATIDEMSELYETIRMIGGGGRPESDDLKLRIGELEDDLCKQEPAIQILMDSVDPELKDYQRFDPDLSVHLGGISWTERWLPARQAALKALGLHTVGAEAKRRIQGSGEKAATGMIGRYTGADFELVWPRQLFAQEAEILIAQGGQNFKERCEWLLTEAFAGSAAADVLIDNRSYNDPWSNAPADGRPSGPKEFLAHLVASVDQLREATVRSPYWSHRRRGTGPGQLDMSAVVREFVRIVSKLQTDGYFENAFPKICVDDHESLEVDATDLLRQMVDIPNLHWPLHADELLVVDEALFDVMEALHDLVARPRSRSFHSYGGCGWHYYQFAIEPGRVLYRWRVNQLLDRSELGLRLSDDGEDVGRLIAVTDDARAELATIIAGRADTQTGDRVRYGMALFRARGATEHDKHSGVLVLAGVLEERRQFLKNYLVKKDESALFEIANNFAIRHRNENQRADYDPIFLDWIFWWYLATIELSDRLLARAALRPDEAPPF
jgi:hypothetical protein